jgi:hypothetical protein
MADRTRLNREIAEQHGGGQTQTKAPGRETAKETEEPHAVEGEPITEQQPAEQQPATEPTRRRSVFDAPLQADLDAQQVRDGDKADPTDE